MAKMTYIGHKNFNEKDFVFLYGAAEKNSPEYVGLIAKEYKFVKKELLPLDISVGDIINVDLEENSFGKISVVGIDIIRKGGAK